METIERDGETYTLRNLDEITYGAKDRVKYLQEELLDSVLATDKLISPEVIATPLESTDNDSIIELAKEKRLVKPGKTLADLTKVLNFDEEKKEIMAVMLMTDLTYFELTEPKGLCSTLQWLIEEAKQRIGTYEDFSTGLRLSTHSLQAPQNVHTKAKGGRSTKN